MGATLAKIAVRSRDDAAPDFDLVPSQTPSKVMEAVLRLEPRSVGLTGGGAAELARLLPWDTARVNEFAAWGSGCAALLRSHSAAPPERYLLVSLGTGTSIMLVDGMAVTRVGGTALGGGTLVGLGAQLAGERRFEALAELATKGARERVDLRVSDLYRPGEFPLAGELTASAFGKLARLAADAEPPRPEDLAQALMGLIGENVALLCGGLDAVCSDFGSADGAGSCSGGPGSGTCAGPGSSGRLEGLLPLASAGSADVGGDARLEQPAFQPVRLA